MLADVRPRLAFLVLALSACSSPDVVPSPDARADASPVEDAAPGMDVTDDAAPPPDAPPLLDASPPADAAPPPDASPDVAPPRDAPPSPDAPPAPDATPDARVDGAPDAAGPDATADAPRPTDATCAGAFTVAVTAPAANQEIETCTRAGMPVYFEFAAAPGVGAASVEFAFRTPDGALAPPAVPPDTSAPFSVRRQVGGPMGATVSLATFGLRGTWYIEVTARDACGRTATARQPFTLTYTNRMCPNP